MANLTETEEWVDAIYQIATTDPVLGGPPDLAQGLGTTNVPLQQLANRTAWLAAAVAAEAMLTRLKEVHGAGSGLDSDLLDGKQASEFLEKTGGTLTGAVTFKGRPIVEAINNWIQFQIDGQYRSLFRVLRGEEELWTAGVDPNGDLDFNPLGSRALRMDGNRIWHDGDAQQSLGWNGYQILPSGLILQWGNAGSELQSGVVERAFPIVFPNQCFRVTGTDGATSDTGTAHIISIRQIDRGSFRYINTDLSGAQTGSVMHWVAVGY